jgi:hypothetical protein
MRVSFSWESGSSETTDGRQLEGRVLTIEVWRFALSIWFMRVER